MLAAELRNEFKVEAKLKPWWIGAFDIIVDGKTVFAKAQIGRFPNKGEISTIIQELQAGTKN